MFFIRTPLQENMQALTTISGWSITYQQLNALFHTRPEFPIFYFPFITLPSRVVPLGGLAHLAGIRRLLRGRGAAVSLPIS